MSDRYVPRNHGGLGHDPTDFAPTIGDDAGPATTASHPEEPVSGTVGVPGTTQSFNPEDAPVPHSHMDEH